MEISFNSASLVRNVGYGVAGYNVVTSLQALGHKVPFKSASAPIHLDFCQPKFWFKERTGYHIAYVPWESTALPEGWTQAFNSADEVWTPSPIIADVFAKNGVVVPIHVYEHGVEPVWFESRRKKPRGRILKFLHMGEPAPRKGAQMAMEVFREVFGKQEDVSLTIKAHGSSAVRIKNRRGEIQGLPTKHNNVFVDTMVYPPDELVNYINTFDVLVYPSYGEGYGLIPLQAMALGKPTICTTAWAPYKTHILPGLGVSSGLHRSPWPHVHPGEMWWPSRESLADCYKNVYEKFDTYQNAALDESHKIERKYDWLSLTEKAFQHLENKFATVG